ncbi:MAG: glycosyltransferase family 9 protein, partial [Odoribacter sp.]|nr:glycosyltransferase family 9 protein [Odoribacter sp.]
MGKKYPSIVSLIEKVSYENEILLIAKCSAMVCMDSSNMHLASLLRVPIISIWGATVPEVGFYPPYEKIENTIVKRLNCQPCSFFG